MFMEKSPDVFNKLKLDAEVLLNEKDTMNADEYEQALIELNVNLIEANSSCELYEEELAWFTERFGFVIYCVNWM